MSHGTQGPNTPRPPEPQNHEDGEFRLTRGWVVVGLVALALGLVAGLLMSTSWLR